MRKTILMLLPRVGFLIAPAPALAQAEVCQPTPPDHVMEPEGSVPGLGAFLGHEAQNPDGGPSFFGRAISEFLIVPQAQGGEPGSASLVGYWTGDDCVHTLDHDDE